VTDYWQIFCPFLQLPLAHSASAPHAWPAALRHAPAPLQIWVPLHAGLLSVAFLGTNVHVPMLPVTLHARQVPVQALSQQTPSTHTPLAHCALIVHACPFFARHAPAPSHTLLPVQPPFASVWPLGTKLHAPSLPERLHAWQVPLHAVLQHTPSTQLPPKHWLPAVHVAPGIFFAAHVVPWQ
jgi:hypothetical protein